MDKYKMPDLPDNQRWNVRSSLGSFLIVELQEKRRWGWKTIASSSEYLSTGTWGLSRCVHRIQNREEYARYEREREQRSAADRARIPFGTSKES